MRSLHELDAVPVEAVGVDAHLGADVGDHPMLLHVDDQDETAAPLVLKELKARTNVTKIA